MECKTIILGDPQVGKTAMLKIYLDFTFDHEMPQDKLPRFDYYVFKGIPDREKADGTNKGEMIYRLIDTLL